MTKMASMPIYGKNPSKIFGTGGPISRNLVGSIRDSRQPSIVCSNDGPGLILTYFTVGKVKFCNLGFSIRKSENWIFSETIVASDLKVGRSRHQIEFMKVCEY